MGINKEMRQSVLNDRHLALGADLTTTSWNDMPLPQNYSTDTYDEMAAVRYRAGLIDVSALKMLNVTGPDALKFLNHLLTSDISKTKPGDSHISNIVNEDGALIEAEHYSQTFRVSLQNCTPQPLAG